MKAALAASGMIALAALAGAWPVLAAPAIPAAAVPMASDLRRDSLQAARAGVPLVLFFSLPDCRYCHTVRHHYLAPLLRGPGAADGGQLIREIEVGGGRAATGFDGAATTHAALARRFAVGFAPTVLFVGPVGQSLAEPLLGGDTAGMYGALLDARLAAARHAAASISANAVSAASAPERTAP